MTILYKDKRDQHDFPNLEPRLIEMALVVAAYLREVHGLPLVVTDGIRTKEDMRRLYPNEPGRQSPHMDGRAIDVRSRDLTDEQARQLESWVNETYQLRTGLSSYRFCYWHNSGFGKHFHLQVPR